MHLLLLAVPAFFYFALPLTLALWLGSSRASSRVEWAAVLLALVAYLTVLVTAGAWTASFGLAPRGWLVTVVALLAAHGLCRLVRVPAFTRPRGRAWSVYLGSGLLLTLALCALPRVLDRRHFSGAPAALSFPLRDGRYAILNGGGNAVINPHALVPAQRYALDIAKLGALDLSEPSLLSSQAARADITRYAIYGDAVHAPCGGTVLFSADGFPDVVPPAMDAAHPAGNHVAVRCDEMAGRTGVVTVLLAHLEPGSVRVRAGDRVTAGRLLGRAGNSGDTSEPHLHLQAIRGEARDLDSFATGEPVAMLFDDRFLARNDVMEVDDPQAL